MVDQVPMISYRTTIVNTNETHDLVARDVSVMLHHVLANMELAQIAYDDELEMDSTIDPKTDVLSLTFTWKKSGELYATVEATKLIAGQPFINLVV